MKIKHQKVYCVNKDCDIQRLHHICRVNNERIHKGEECTLTWGHTSEIDPELITIRVGYADNFIVENDCLYADFHYEEAWSKEQLQTHNKVSAELWYDDVITPIALLGRNRPQLNLGVVHYQMPNRVGENGEIEHKPYITEEEVENMSPAEIQQLFVETMNHSEFYSKFCDLLENVIPKLQESVKHMEDTLAPLLAEEAEEPEHEDIASELEGEAKEIEGVDPKEGEVAEEKTENKPEEVPAMAEEAKEEVKPEVEEKKEEVVEKNDMASSSANNGYIPDLENEKKKVKKYQMDLLKVEEEKADLVRKYQTEVRKNELNELSKTYFFNPKDEVEIVSTMDADQWEMHKKIIATRYQKSPAGRTVSPAVETEDRNVKSPDKVQKAIKLAQEKNISFKMALEQV